MCGIAGFYNLSRNNFVVDDTLLYKMQQRLAHRGPDGYRIWKSDQHQMGIVHRRLSIMDLSQAGFQPMFDQEHTVMVCCNGEIYNHPQLRAELEALGYRYRSNSDTETIVYAYKQWGIQALERLEGMFAILIFDMRTQELYLVRDRIGIKPFYFSLQGGVLSFASEIKALWEQPWMQKTIKPDALYHYLTYLASPAPMTLYEGVYKLPAGFYMRVDAAKQLTFHEWYNPVVQPVYTKEQYADEQFCVDTIRSLLRASVEQQMMSDVPFGVFLSGGIDSSLNVALMSEFTNKVNTFTVSFADGPEYNEVAWARKVARHFNTNHHEIEITEKDAFEFFQTMVYHQDEPLGDCVCVPLYYVSKLLRDSGVVVVQVGEGSDELFCGYSTYAQYLDMYPTWQRTQKYVPDIAKRAVYQAAKKLAPLRFNRLDMVRNWSQNRSFFWSGAVVLSEEWKQTLMQPQQVVHDPVLQQIYPGFEQVWDSYGMVDYHLKQLNLRDAQADVLKSMIYLELKHRLPELLLMRVDKMTMATSVEARVPFLDHKLVEFAMHIPQELKYKDGQTKYILKKACEGILPHDIIYRKKMGFAAPTTRWFKKGAYFANYMQDMLTQHNELSDLIDKKAVLQMLKTNQESSVDYSYQLWALQNAMAFYEK